MFDLDPFPNINYLYTQLQASNKICFAYIPITECAIYVDSERTTKHKVLDGSSVRFISKSMNASCIEVTILVTLGSS